MKNIVLTGGTGFIGTHVHKRLQKMGYNLFILTRKNIQSKEKNVNFVRCDLYSDLSIKRCTSRLPAAFILIDLAAQIPVPGKVITLQEYIDMNVRSHIKFFEFMKERIQKVIYVSTVDVYGNMEGKSFVETQQRKPLTDYGLSKFLLEEYYLFAQRNGTIPITILRLSQVYGLGAHPYNALPKFLDAAHSGEATTLFGKGEEERTYIHIDDVSEGIILSLQKEKTGVYNLSGKETRSLLSLLEMVKKYAPKNMTVQVQKRQKPLQHQKMSIAKIQKELGFHPRISLEQGIRDYLTLC